MEEKKARKKEAKKHSLPWIRFTTVATIIVAIDSISCVALWIAGGNSKYLEDSVEDFSLVKSTFDLACLAVVRGVILIALLYLLERAVIRDVSLSTTGKTRRRTASNYNIALHIFILVIAFACVCYAAVKGGFVIHEWRRGRYMHVTYKVLCIVATVFPLVELLLGAASFYYMGKLRTQQVMLIVNEMEEQDEGSGVMNAEKKKASFRTANLKRLLLMAKPEYGLMGVGIIFLFISTAATSAGPYFFGKVIDYAIPKTNCSSDRAETNNGSCVKRSMDKMNHEVVVLVILFVIGSGAALIRSWLFTLAGYRFVARLRKQLFAAVLLQEVGFFDVTRTGELTNRLSSDTQVIQNAVTVNISMLVRYLLQIILSLILMFWQSARLTAVLLSVVPIIAIGAVQYGRMLKSLQKEFQDKLAHASSTAEESISNIRTVRFFSNESKMVSLYGKDIDLSYLLGKKLAAVIGTFSGVVAMLAQGAAALVLWYGGYLVYHSQLSPGALTSLMLYTLNLALAFGFLSSLYGDFMKAVGASVRVFELLDRHSAITDGSLQLDALKGEIQFDNVMFSYPSRPDTVVLKGVSFTVNPGQVVALVGPSGGGKSTIVNLIERFYDLQAGNIYLSGHNVIELDPVWFRNHIGVVSQEPVLFACSISDNISFGREDATHEEIVEAAKQANAHDFISSFDEGYKTMVGERGVRLSGGQKQRIAIARALLLNPSILLLDEATSALDAESEHLVQEAIDRAMKGRTVLVIAHRLSTVRNASQVVVINKGVVVEKGTHDELLASGGVYKRLVLRQLNAGNTNDNNNNVYWTDPTESLVQQ